MKDDDEKLDLKNDVATQQARHIGNRRGIVLELEPDRSRCLFTAWILHDLGHEDRCSNRVDRRMPVESMGRRLEAALARRHARAGIQRGVLCSCGLAVSAAAA